MKRLLRFLPGPERDCTAWRLYNHGFSRYCLDWPGHGNSSRLGGRLALVGVDALAVELLQKGINPKIDDISVRSRLRKV